MPGLLDTLQADSPQGDALRNGLLQFGLALMQGKGNVGQILGQAGTQADTGMKAFQDRQFQDQLRKQQMADIARKRVMEGRQDKLYNEEEALRNLPTQFERTGQQMGNAAALEQTGNLSPFNSTAAVQSANAQPGYDYQGLINRYPQLPGGFDKAMALQNAIKKDTTPIKGSAGDVFFDPHSFKQLAAVPGKEDATNDWKNYARAVSQGYNHTFEQFLTEDANRKAPKVSVSVNSGQKGYENESKLRNDFKSEPIYKDYSEMQTAHKQIKAGIASGSPIGDVTTATKIMKLLDPGSVVRESELAIAMAASGRMDRLKNYVQMQISGNKLTPQQRVDFGNLADDLMAAAGQAYNKKRAEYVAFGKTYKLSEGVLGEPYKASESSGNVKWGDLPP